MVTTKLRNADNCEFGDLDASKSKHMMTYEHSSGGFVLKDMDNFLPGASTISPQFVSEVLDELDTDNLQFGTVDGGTFT